jgi:tripartite-type tricarboxylate transporter receptor subunit TctC
MSLFTKALLPALLAGLTAMAAAGPAQAAFPDRPITVIVPYPVGGASDTLARSLGQKMEEMLHQSVVIETRAGGSGYIGAAAVARAPADGYTILVGCPTDAAIYQAAAVTPPPVNLQTDFAPVAGVSTAPHILVVPSTLPVNDLSGLLGYLKAAPGKYNYASIGIGTLSQLEPELLSLTTGVKIVHVPYKGGAQALMELVAGNSTLMFLSGPNAMPQVKAGKIKVLAVASDKRLALFPDVPTVAEAGVSGFNARNLFGFFAPKNTPPEVVKALSKAMKDALATPDLKKRLEEQGLQPDYTDPVAFSKQINEDFAFFRSVVKKADIKLD